MKQLNYYSEVTVVKTFSDMVYRLAFSHTRNKSDADDIYQEVFLIYLRKKPQFKTEEHRKAWLIRVTINSCKKMWALPWRKKIVPLNETIVFETEEETNLHYELQKLPMKYRTVIQLFYYEDLSIEEISKALKQKPSTVRTQLTRARYKLKEILKEDYYV
ncbi:sigma-70 family RNA polymerase sigma factor [Alkalibaculum sp. M08DMB]|uniref:Sigma-70 family RNA polymerase sigma factor n=1 Tax=Alkalibaculum sporogenes TaxID=2655001 RepID=A0A6A7K451_9FIRM|nr:sigma-70 family RNA polymerase sigma factor [Alkalibaculum sporogenes]MPW24219.1 sigma-70 family RNA polymerase sigma factor [Alkalibaculum sporogenes]